MAQLIRLLPDEVVRHWSTLRGAVMSSLPPIVVKEKAQESAVVQLFLTGLLNMSLLDRNGKAVGFVATTTTRDPVSDRLKLWVWLVKFVEDVTGPEKEELWDALRKVATEKDYEGVMFLGQENPDEMWFKRGYSCFELQ